MSSNTIAIGILKALGFVLIAILVIFILKQISTVLIYFIVSIVFTLIANPIVKFLKLKLKFNNTLAVTTTLVLFVFLLSCFILLFVPLILSQVEKLSLLDLNTIKNNYNVALNQLLFYLSKYNINVSNIIENAKIFNAIDFNFIPRLINIILGVIGNFSVGLVSVMFITFFLLKDKMYYYASFEKLLPAQNKQKILQATKKSKDLLTRYFIGLMFQLFIVFILYLVVLLIFKIDNAFIIAFLCAILNIIPYVGPIISAFFAAILTLISSIQLNYLDTDAIQITIYVVIGFMLVQFIDNNISQPIIFSKSTNSHPLQIFLVILTAGFLFGIIGMIVAVPLFTILKVIAKEFFPNHTFVKLITKSK
ncbi:MAG TPA: AI-2E family transporter [Flavobacterium sp.]|nr:AI-2E family transporter [Flavobacterium sp.]